MLVQMRSPFSGQWLKIDAEDGSIIELAEVGWQDIPQLPAIAMPAAIPRLPYDEPPRPHGRGMPFTRGRRIAGAMKHAMRPKGNLRRRFLLLIGSLRLREQLAL